MRTGLIFITLLVIFVCDATLLQAQVGLFQPAPKGHYDEVFSREKDANGKTVYVVRPHYREIMDVAQKLTPKRLAKIDTDSRCQFCQENSLSPVPRVLLKDEYDHFIKAGVDQRARALRAFLKDYHLTYGRPRFVREGLMNGSVLQDIVARTGELPFIGLPRIDHISFFYGPDILRDAKGDFRVLEDNIGNLGGFGDLPLALSALYQNVPEYPRLHEQEPIKFYQDLIARYQARALPEDGEVVMIRVPHEEQDDENRRLDAIMRSLGVKVVTDASQIMFDETGVWLPTNGNSFRSRKSFRNRKRVGFIIMRSSIFLLDPASETVLRKLYFNYVRYFFERASDASFMNGKQNPTAEYLILKEFIVKNGGFKLLPPLQALTGLLIQLGEGRIIHSRSRSAFPGLLDAILDGRVASSHTPGTEFVADKEFYGYVEKIIEFYLGEKPILRSIPTISILRPEAGTGRLVYDEKLIRRMRKSQKDYVIKSVSGGGGNGVWVGAHISKRKFEEGIQAILEYPNDYVIQPYMAPSMIGESITDLRPITDVGPKGPAYVSDIPWGRVISRDKGDGRLNISQNGGEVTVIVRSSARMCAALFAPTH